MVNQKNDEYYKNKALIHIEAIIEYTKIFLMMNLFITNYY